MNVLDLILGGKAETRGNPLDNPAISLADERYWSLLTGSAVAFSGETVDEATAMGVPAVSCAVNAIADTIAALPLKLMKDTDAGRIESTKDPLFKLLHDVVNEDRETSYDFRKYMLARLLLKGRAFAFIERNKAGKVMNLWKLNPDFMKVEITNGRKLYKYRVGDTVTVYKPSEIIDLVWQHGADGISHVDPVYQARNAIGLAIAAERSASIMFENGGVPPLALQTPINSPGSVARAANDVKAALMQARDHGKNILVMPVGTELKPIGLDPEKQQMIEAQKWAVVQIARVYKIPPAFLMDLTTGNFNNSEQQSLFFAKMTISPLCRMIEQEFNAKLFSDRNTVNEVVFDLTDLVKADFLTMMNGLRTGTYGGFLTANEARVRLGLPLSTDENADKLLIQAATTTVEALPDADDAQDDPNEQQETTGPAGENDDGNP